MNRATRQFLAECKETIAEHQDQALDSILAEDRYKCGYNEATITFYSRLALMLETGVLRMRKGAYK